MFIRFGFKYVRLYPATIRAAIIGQRSGIVSHRYGRVKE